MKPLKIMKAKPQFLLAFDRSLRSRNKALLSVPCKPSRKDGHRAFVQCAPVVWNALPLSIREASSISQFKTLLKTHLFTAHEDLN